MPGVWFDCRGHRRTFWGDGNILRLERGGACLSVYSCQPALPLIRKCPSDTQAQTRPNRKDKKAHALIRHTLLRPTRPQVWSWAEGRGRTRCQQGSPVPAPLHRRHAIQSCVCSVSARNPPGEGHKLLVSSCGQRPPLTTAQYRWSLSGLGLVSVSSRLRDVNASLCHPTQRLSQDQHSPKD